MRKFIFILFIGFTGNVYAQSSGDFVIAAPVNTPIQQATPGEAASMAVDTYGNGHVTITTAQQTPIPVSLSGQVLSEATPAPMVTALATTVPTAYSTPQFPAVAAGLKTITACNYTNQLLWCAYAGGTTTQVSIPAGACLTDNYGSRDQKMSAAFGCIHPGTLPSSGDLEIWGNN